MFNKIDALISDLKNTKNNIDNLVIIKIDNQIQSSTEEMAIAP